MQKTSCQWFSTHDTYHIFKIDISKFSIFFYFTYNSKYVFHIINMNDQLPVATIQDSQFSLTNQTTYKVLKFPYNVVCSKKIPWTPQSDIFIILNHLIIIKIHIIEIYSFIQVGLITNLENKISVSYQLSHFFLYVFKKL